MLQDPESTLLGSQSEIEERIRDDRRAVYYGPVAAFLQDPKIRVFYIDEMRRSHIGFTLAKDSEFLKLFNFHLIKLKETGLFVRLKDRYLGRGDQSDQVISTSFSVTYSANLHFSSRFQADEDDDANEAATSLGYANLFLPVAILFSGFFLSCCLVLIEHLNKWCGRIV